MATKCSILRVSVVLPPVPPTGSCLGPPGGGTYSAFRLSCLWLIDLRYSEVSMSIVLNVSFHCSAKEIRPEFHNPISVGGGIHPLKAFPSPLPSIDRFQTF